MTNDQMKAGRFAQWAKARKRIAKIVQALDEGRTVTLVTHRSATHYTREHRDMFKATKTGAWVQSGSKWLCIDFTTTKIW